MRPQACEAGARLRLTSLERVSLSCNYSAQLVLSGYIGQRLRGARIEPAQGIVLKITTRCTSEGVRYAWC
jgi:hypothetical protein